MTLTRCVATSKYKEYPDDHVMLLNLFRTDMTEVRVAVRVRVRVRVRVKGWGLAL